jgi:hypothetical protein
LRQKNNYPSAAGVPGYGCGGITIIGASGEEYLYSGIWVRIEYLEYSQNILNLKLCAYHLGRGFFFATHLGKGWEVVPRPCINLVY